MVEEDYSDYSTTKTYSVKLKNVAKVERVSKKLGLDKSKTLNKMVEDFKE